MERTNTVWIDGVQTFAKATGRKFNAALSNPEIGWITEENLEISIQWLTSDTKEVLDVVLPKAVRGEVNTRISVEYLATDLHEERILKLGAIVGWIGMLAKGSVTKGHVTIKTEMLHCNLDLLNAPELDSEIVDVQLLWAPSDTEGEWIQVLNAIQPLHKATIVFNKKFATKPVWPVRSIEPKIKNVTLDVTVVRVLNNRRDNVSDFLLNMMQWFVFQNVRTVVLHTDARLAPSPELNEMMRNREFVGPFVDGSFSYAWIRSGDPHPSWPLQTLVGMALSDQTLDSRPAKRFLVRDGDHAIGLRILSYLLPPTPPTPPR